MSKYMTKINAGQLLKALQEAGMIDSKKSVKLEKFIQAQQQKQELPLYLRILLGISALIASLCFIGFLIISEIISVNSKALLWGLIFVGGASFLAKTSKDKDNTVKHNFLIQSSLCAMGVGKILFVMGFSIMFSRYSDWVITLAILIITALTYHVYRMSIDRFLSTLAIFTSLLLIIQIKMIFHASTNNNAEIVLNLSFLIQMILAGFLLTHGRIRRDYIPIAYATAFSLCLTVIYIIIYFNVTFMNIILTLSLVGLIGWAAGNLKKMKTEPLMLASLGSLLFGIISAPGVTLSICLMLIGYAKHEKFLLLMGILLMPVFIFLYYYNLDISLMAKSGVLVGSGIILLTGRFYLAAKKLNWEAV